MAVVVSSSFIFVELLKDFLNEDDDFRVEKV